MMTLDLSLKTENGNYWLELEKFLTSELDRKKILKGFEFANQAHSTQKRASGEPYICHPIWIAKIIAQLNIGEEAILAALLHDCVEDTTITLEDIAKEFGDEVSLLVNGLTEVKEKTKGVEIHKTNIEVFRKFLFSSVNDVRVLIIRLVDKLHNSLTVEFLAPEKQIKYAREILGIYAPIAEYVGLHYFKRVLEDIAFKISHPEEAQQIEKLLEDQSEDEKKALTKIKEKIIRMLKINSIKNYEIEGRIKSLYSSFLKVKNKGITRLTDRVGIRILTESVADCYTILGLLHSKYKYLPEEFDDYISSPKPNGYRTIKTTLKWKKHLTVEIQIRTKEMHQFNEFGPASHIVYKLSKNINENGVGYEWVKDLIKWQKNDTNVNNYRIKVLSKYIYVFTPKGDTIQLPNKSTALDFAYRIHTEIGDHCKGSLINKKMSKINTVLKTGDLVEILTNKKLNVNKNWLDFVRTNLAKEQIKKMINK